MTTPLRRQLQAELFMIGEVIQTQPKPLDEITTIISQWHHNFTVAIRGSIEEEKVLKIFTKLLQDILHDSFLGVHTPLEKVSYLGSDGEVYGKRALLYYLHKMPKELRGRSPCHPDKEDLFYISSTPHAPVESAVSWLERRGNHLPIPSEIVDELSSLELEGKLPLLPTREVAEAQEEARKLAEELSDSETESVSSDGRDEFEDIAEKIRNATDRMRQRFAKCKAEDQEKLRKTREQASFWEARAAERSERLDKVKKDLEKAKEGLSQEKQDLLHLERSICETEKAIADHNSRGNDRGWMSIALVVASIGIAIAQPEFATTATSNGSQTTVMFEKIFSIAL